MKEMLEESEALERILARVNPLPAESRPLLQALGRFAARELRAAQPLPGFDNSSMDGYALALDQNGGGTAAGTRLRVGGEQPAGLDRGLSAKPGLAIRIFTGAPLPAGTGAVVMQEDVERAGDEIVLREGVEPGENIRRAGADLARGQKLFEPGAKMTAARLALLASQGLATVEVGRAPKVAVLTTGDELRAPGQPLRPGEIYESNGVALAALAAALGAEAVSLGSAVDDPAALDARIAEGLAGNDALIVAGGVSVGERDFVRERLAAAGVRLDLWRVRVKPGKPFLYGQAAPDNGSPGGGAHVFGLPGNPVSAFVTFLLFVRPALLKLMGASADALSLPAQRATTAVELVNRANRPHYQHGLIDARGEFITSGRQESHALFGLSRSRALVRVEAETRVPAGAKIQAFYWEGF
jgi:molybdopterin molybdotransferase